MTDDWAAEDTASGGNWEDFDTGVAHSARVYDYWLGGKDNFAADRAVGDIVVQAFPDVVLTARANRAFLGRTVAFLAADAGIRQFLDIGTGIPAANNTHQVAQAIAPQTRVVYVDNDPIVLSHARALLASHPAGITGYLDADLRDPERILQDAASTLDFTQPIALMLIAVLHFITDDDNPHQIVATLLDALPPGSYLALTHGTKDIVTVSQNVARATMNGLNRSMAEQVTLRDRATVERFFAGLELVEPGLVPASQWRPDAEADPDQPIGLWSGIGRKR
ncbi:MAG TPA: SAM-dependent methyltransferase [Streptosporangiaceae bacterium]|nr:SAM-dependent methyltransferase [Streptosporangiaceae bacterium]